MKDVLRLPGEPGAGEISSLVRTANYVPESAPILQVLQDMRARRFTFALVLDEHGGIEGIVTIKDLVSELVGELQDEYDPGVPSVVRVAPGEWLADGRIPIEDLEAELECDLPDGPYATAGGLLMTLAGRIPQEGDVVRSDGLTFTVLQMDRNRVDRIRVEMVS